MKSSHEEHIIVDYRRHVPVPIDGDCPSSECSGCVKQAYLNRSRASLQADRGCQLKSSYQSGELTPAKLSQVRMTNRICQVRRRVFPFILHLLTAVDVIACATEC